MADGIEENSNMAGFQTTILTQLAPGIEGDFASANPIFSTLAAPGGLVSGPAGVTVGRFAWADPEGVVRNLGGGGPGPGCRLGFVGRDQPALITTWLAQATMVLQPGVDMTMFQSADVWCRFAGGAQIGQKVYANFADGSAVAAASGAPTGATSTSFSIQPETNAWTGSIANGILTISGGITGTIYPGTIITSGTNVPTGEMILDQITPLLSGEALGGIGRYETSINDSLVIASETMGGGYGLLTLNATIGGTGAFHIGNTLTTSGGLSANTTITADSTNGASLTGAGGAGTYVCTPSQTNSSGTITGATNVETSWYVDTYAAAGELAMISTHG